MDLQLIIDLGMAIDYKVVSLGYPLLIFTEKLYAQKPNKTKKNQDNITGIQYFCAY